MTSVPMRTVLLEDEMVESRKVNPSIEGSANPGASTWLIFGRSSDSTASTSMPRSESSTAPYPDHCVAMGEQTSSVTSNSTVSALDTFLSREMSAPAFRGHPTVKAGKNCDPLETVKLKRRGNCFTSRVVVVVMEARS